MMAQTAGKCLDAEKKHPGKAMLAKITYANFREWVKPDQTAIINAEIRTNRERFATARCNIEVMSKQACSAELFFIFVPFEEFAIDYIDEVLEVYLSRNS